MLVFIPLILLHSHTIYYSVSLLPISDSKVFEGRVCLILPQEEAIGLKGQDPRLSSCVTSCPQL